MLKALIIDDEENSQASLKGKLELFCPEIERILIASTVDEAVEAVRTETPDVLFLDVNLAEETGFEVLEKLKEEDLMTAEVVFTTAHDEYAIKVSAIDYLLKPIDAEELVKAIRKIEAKKEMNPGYQLNVLLENFRQASDSPKKIVIPSSEGMHIIRVSEIMRCESSSNYTQFFLQNGKVLLASKTLKEFDNMLTDYNFERIHKSHLVNMNFVKKYMQRDGGYLIMNDESQIPVANRKKEQLLSMLKSM
jgi:two-component system LytT family response regulator